MAAKAPSRRVDFVGLVVETMEQIGITRVSRWIFNCYLIHDGLDA